MPLPSYARVTNLSNGRSLIVRVNDRGPYHGNRIIDVSTRAADLLGFRTSGTAWVTWNMSGGRRSRAPTIGFSPRRFGRMSPRRRRARSSLPRRGSRRSGRQLRSCAAPAMPAFRPATRIPPARGRCLTPQGRVDATAPINSSTAAGFTRAQSFRIQLIGALTFCWSMILPENRIPLFRIML